MQSIFKHAGESESVNYLRKRVHATMDLGKNKTKRDKNVEKVFMNASELATVGTYMFEYHLSERIFLNTDTSERYTLLLLAMLASSIGLVWASTRSACVRFDRTTSYHASVPRLAYVRQSDSFTFASTSEDLDHNARALTSLGAHQTVGCCATRRRVPIRVLQHRTSTNTAATAKQEKVFRGKDFASTSKMHFRESIVCATGQVAAKRTGQSAVSTNATSSALVYGTCPKHDIHMYAAAADTAARSSQTWPSCYVVAHGAQLAAALESRRDAA
jgi:hypothetical protein